MLNVTASATVHTHYQISDQERERRTSEHTLNDRYANLRRRATASYLHKRAWTNTSKDRHNGGYAYFGPGWMLPRVIATITASIVWGSCGSMADMPEY